MNKKKIGLIAGISAAIIIVIVITIVAIVNSNKNKISFSDKQTYKVKVELPKEKEIQEKYTFVKNDKENPKKEMNNVFSDFAIVGEKANIEFQKKTYVFQNTLEYKEKYGNEKSGFENFKKYIKDTDITFDMYKNIKEIEINGTQAIQYNYDNNIIIVLNTDNIDTETYIEIKVYPKSEEDINKIIDNEEIQSIINTVKFSKK